MRSAFFCVFALFYLIGNAQKQLPVPGPSKVKTEKWRYSSTLTEEELYNVDRLHYMPKEDWEKFKQDPRFDANRVTKILTDWKEENKKPKGVQKSTDSSTGNCYWIEPTDEYEHPNTIQWPGNQGNSTDNYSAVINLGWNFNYFGQNFNQVVLTTKGTIVLGNAGYIDFTPSSFPTPLGTESDDEHDHICGFWTDFDFGASGDLYYLVTDDALYVNYIDVGYWPNQADKTNTFQMIICADGSDVIEGDNNVQFYYKDMQFANSQISGAQGGLNANANIAIVGADRVTGNAQYTFGRFNLGDNEYNGPYGVNANQQDGVLWLNDRVIEFNTALTSLNVNIAPVTIGEACDTMYMCQGEIFNFNVAFTAPESNQNITITTTQSDSGFSTTTETLTNAAQLVNATFVAGPDNTGTNVVTITGTDNGNPNLSTTATYYFIVTDDEAPPISIDGVTSICAGGSATLTATEGFDCYIWSNGGTTQSVEATQNGTITVTGISGGCESTATLFLDVTPYFIPPLEGGNDPIVMCPGQDTTICVLGDWVSYEWFVYPGYEGEFAAGAPLDEACTQVTGNVNGNYGIIVTDSSGCEGLNIKLVTIIESFIDPINEENEGAYCDGLESVDFTGGFSNPAQGALTIYGLSTSANGWQGSYLNVYVYEEGSETPDAEYFFTTFNAFTIYNDVEIGVGDSIVVEYVPNGVFNNNSIWLLNCGDNDPIIITLPTEEGIVWTGLSTCTSQPLTGTWTVSGPPGWSMTEMDVYDTQFTPGGYGLYTLCFNDPACSIDHCYDLEYTEPPTLSLSPGGDMLLCDNETGAVNLSITDIGGTAEITWSGTGVDPSNDMLSATFGPYTNYVTTTLIATITNGCGSATDSFTIEHQPDVPEPTLTDQFLCNNGNLILDPIPNNQDNPNLEYEWTPGNETGSTLTVTTSGVYSVVVSNDCDESNEVEAEIVLVPNAVITTSPDDEFVSCDNGQATLTVNFQQPQIYDISWDNGSDENSITVTEDGEYCWEVTDNLNCGTLVTGCTEVTISSTPVAQGGSTSADILCPSECMPLDMNVAVNNASFSWSTNCNGYPVTQNDEVFNFCADNVPVACLGNVITITGTATNICGSDQTTWVVQPNACEIVIPNVITPNGNELNDYFFIDGLENYTDVKLNIYNRWGNLIYESTDYKNDWYAGDMAEGTYYYTITLPFGIKTAYEGHLTILK